MQHTCIARQLDRYLAPQNVFQVYAKVTEYQYITKIVNCHRLHGSGSTIVTVTSKVKGKTEDLTPCRSETP